MCICTQPSSKCCRARKRRRQQCFASPSSPETALSNLQEQSWACGCWHVQAGGAQKEWGVGQRPDRAPYGRLWPVLLQPQAWSRRFASRSLVSSRHTACRPAPVPKVMPPQQLLPICVCRAAAANPHTGAIFLMQMLPTVICASGDPDPCCRGLVQPFYNDPTCPCD